MSRIDWAIRDTMSIENDAPRVNVWERGRPSFQFLLNARDPTPGPFLFALSAQMPSTVRTARAPTDLKPNLIRVKKRDDERAHRREGGEGVKEFQHLGTSDQVFGRPRTECVARVFYCECMHPQLLNAILTNICSVVTNTIPRPAEPDRIVRVCPTCLRFQNIPDRRGDSGYNVNRKRRIPRKCTRARAALFSVFVKMPGIRPPGILICACCGANAFYARTARAPTDLKPNLIRVKKRDDERARIGR